MTLNELREALGADSATIGAALEEAAAACSEAAAGWVDTRKQPRVTIYIVDGGIIHVVSGERDRKPDERKLGDSAETKAAWRQVPVTSDAACSFTVLRASRSPGGETTITRLWGLRFGDEPDEDLAVASPPTYGEGSSRAADPAPFMRAAMGAIARVRSNAAQRGSG